MSTGIGNVTNRLGPQVTAYLEYRMVTLLSSDFGNLAKNNK